MGFLSLIILDTTGCTTIGCPSTLNPGQKYLETQMDWVQVIGGFHLVDLIITELKDHMICYKLECSHWWKIYL